MACTTCNKTNCCCAVSTPYYASVSTCTEDHTEEVVTQEFAYGVCPDNSWNVPQCGQSATLIVGGVVGVTIGAFIWHPSYGYFEIISVNSHRGEIVVSNTCITGNASAGVQIPACTCFTVTPPPCCNDSDQANGVFVAYDFTAPADGICLDITLTSVEGLIAGNNVQIGSGIYLLSEVKGNNVVTICNEGEGITPGTPVVARNTFNFYQYPVQPLDTNPCSEDTITAGSVIVCEDLSTRVITGSTTGHVLTLTNATTGAAAYQATGIADIFTIVPQDTSADIGATVELSSILTSTLSNDASISLNNTSAVRTLKTFFTVVGNAKGIRAINTPGELLSIQAELQVSFNGGAWTSTGIVPFAWEDDASLPYGIQLTYSDRITTPVSTNDTVEARMQLIWIGGADSTMSVTDFNVTITAIGTTA